MPSSGKLLSHEREFVRRERGLAARLSLPLSNTIQDLQQTQEPRQTPTRQKTDPAVSDAPQTVSRRWAGLCLQCMLAVAMDLDLFFEVSRTGRSWARWIAAGVHECSPANRFGRGQMVKALAWPKWVPKRAEKSELAYISCDFWLAQPI